MALAVTVEPERDSVRLDFTATGTNNRVRITRTSPSGAEVAVRSWDPGTVVPGPVIARDFEIPLGVPVTYKVEQWTDPSGAVTSETATITVPVLGDCDTWLNDLVRAGNSQRVTVETLDELEYAVTATTHTVLGRRPPIVVSDIAHTPSFDLSFITDTEDGRLAARSTLGNGVPVLLRTPPDWGVGNLYFAVLGYSEHRITKRPTLAARLWEVSAVQVERPDADLFIPLGPKTYRDVKDTFASYADVKAERATYDALLYDWEGADPTDLIPWPPADA